MAELTKVVAKVYLFDENDNTLLIRRSKTDERRPLEWDIPGGAVDEGENYLDAAVREVAEETGIEISRENIHIIWADSAMRPQGNVVWIVFVTRIQKIEPKLSFEHDRSDWVSVDKAIKMIDYDRQLKSLNHLVENNLFPPR